MTFSGVVGTSTAARMHTAFVAAANTLPRAQLSACQSLFLQLIQPRAALVLLYHDRQQVLDLLKSQRDSSSDLTSAPDAEAVELLWEECGLTLGDYLTRPAWERFMLQVGGRGEAAGRAQGLRTVQLVGMSLGPNTVAVLLLQEVPCLAQHHH